MTRTALDLTIIICTFVALTVVAELLGAANLGTAATFGQLAFAAVLLWAIVRP